MRLRAERDGGGRVFRQQDAQRLAHQRLAEAGSARLGRGRDTADGARLAPCGGKKAGAGDEPPAPPSHEMPGLRVAPAAMQRNLDAQRGFVFAEALATALAPALGRGAAQSLAEAACAAAQARGGSLRDAAAADPRIGGALDPRVLDALFTAPAPGAADAMIDRTLAAWAARPRGQPA